MQLLNTESLYFLFTVFAIGLLVVLPNHKQDKHDLLFIYLFYLYIYPPGSQESDGGAIHVHGVSNYPSLLPE